MYVTDVVSGDNEQVVDHVPVFIKGLGFDRDCSRLLVTATLSSNLLSYDASTFGPSQLVHTFVNGWPDGMAVSARGDYWVALTGADRIDIVDAEGRRVGMVELPSGSLPTNVCIGGEGSDELFVTAAQSQALLRVRFDGDDAEGARLKP